MQTYTHTADIFHPTHLVSVSLFSRKAILLRIMIKLSWANTSMLMHVVSSDLKKQIERLTIAKYVYIHPHDINRESFFLLQNVFG